ncbi:hypothetical protein LSH36_1120g00022, partial [Paralvinella palmiformis]
MCSLFPVSSTQASDPCYNGGENKWTAKTDVYANSSLSIKNARTLEACRQSCVSNPECNGIEYKGSVSPGKCWILNHLEKPQLLPASGIIHETLERCVIADIDSCTNGGENKWTTKTDVHLNNGYLIIAARTLDACRQSCVSNPDCNAIDYKGSVSSGKCWIFIYLKDPQLLPESGTIHETLERCVLLAE